MKSSTKPRIGIIGAGRLGTVIARQALAADYQVSIANSKKDPTSLRFILSVLLPDAEPATVQKVVEQSDIVILAIPLNKYKQLPADLFAHKLVIDAMNYWSLTEGYSAEFEDDSTSSSEYIQGYLPHTTIVKSLNHVAYNEIEEHSLPKGDPDRRAVLIAGNDVDAKRQVRDFIDDLGFDSVDLGDLQEGKKFQPGTKLFNTRFRAQDLTLSSRLRWDRGLCPPTSS
jgi:predicted dinucleotide-binding enzyme